MKKKLIPFVLFIILAPNIFSQLGPITLINSTSCSMYYAIEGASYTNCTGQGGVTGWIDPNATINNIYIRDDFPFDGLSIDFVNWALTEPSFSSCTILQSAQDFDISQCGGSAIHGQASGCCIDDFDISISGMTVTIY